MTHYYHSGCIEWLVEILKIEGKTQCEKIENVIFTIADNLSMNARYLKMGVQSGQVG
jgi:hypothetical protein